MLVKKGLEVNNITVKGMYIIISSLGGTTAGWLRLCMFYEVSNQFVSLMLSGEEEDADEMDEYGNIPGRKKDLAQKDSEKTCN